MRTDDWMDFLAADAAPVDRRAPVLRLAAVSGLGLMVAASWAVTVQGLRPFGPDDLAVPMLWWRWAFCLGIAATAWVAFNRLSRPGQSLSGWWRWGFAPLALMATLALAEWVAAAPSERQDLLMGHSASSCPWSIAFLSLPTFAGALWAMRKMAPTRPAWAGAAAGWLSGAVGALAYTLHCTELSAPFLLTWYTLGMALPAVVGAALGRWVLRW